MQLNEMKIIVTGGASGMGRHFSLSLAKGGAAVMACDLNEEGLESLAREAEGLAGSLTTFKANVASEDEVKALFDATYDQLGGANGLVNNAGIFRDSLLVKKDRNTGDIRQMSLKHWQQVLDVDLTGPFLCTREFVSRVIENKAAPAAVVNISSISRYGNPGQSNYSAAKAGLVADTELWAKEMARYGIRFGAVAPGFIDTPILQGMRPEMLDKIVKGVPLRRVGTPEEIFAGIKFVFECDYFTGRCIDIDGGLRM